MFVLAPILASLVLASHGKRVQTKGQRSPFDEGSEANQLQALAAVLTALDPSTGFVPSGLGVSHAPRQHLQQVRPLRMQLAVEPEEVETVAEAPESEATVKPAKSVKLEVPEITERPAAEDLQQLYVGNLPKAAKIPELRQELEEVFSRYGKLDKLQIKRGSYYRYAFVSYSSVEAGAKALQELNNTDIAGSKIHVTASKTKKKQSKDVDHGNVHIKNLPQDWDQEKVDNVFGEFGTIASSRLMTFPDGRKFAFVEFEKAEEAQACVQAMHEKDVRTEEEKAETAEGEEVELLSVQRSQRRTWTSSNNLLVKNLDETTDDASLRSLFEPFGTITSLRAVRDKEGRCKGYGYVCFASRDETTKAIAGMHEKVVNGKPLHVGLENQPKDKQVQSGKQSLAGALPESRANEALEAFVARWGIDEGSVEFLLSLPENVRWNVMRDFEPPAGKRIIGAKLEAFAMKVLKTMRKRLSAQQLQDLGKQTFRYKFGPKAGEEALFDDSD